MGKKRVIVEMNYQEDFAKVAFSATPDAEKELDTSTVPQIEEVNFDKSFSPVNLPRLTTLTAMDLPFITGEEFKLSLSPEESTYIVRAEVEESKIGELSAQQSVAGIYSDVEIQPTLICPGSSPMGTDKDVENLLCVPQLHEIGMDGSGVLIAIVDTGFNLAYLAAHGKQITMDAERSWVPIEGMVPGSAPVSHGTMCAFDAAIAAPKATFLDIQVLRSSARQFSGFLSDAIKAYSHLIGVMVAPGRPGENKSMVVSNSWGMFHPTWDFPPGDPSNYSDNPNHPFNRIVSVLEQLGADILFAAGNCGSNCPDGRCQGVTENAIYGANGHPLVLTISGVDITKNRVGYSTQGPGRLSRDKPDLCGYTHFKGSEVYAADGGTSAATPVVAGVVAAVRTKTPYVIDNPDTLPARIREFMRSNAEDLSVAGFDFDTGFGVVNGYNIYRHYSPEKAIDICKKYPKLCRQFSIPSIGGTLLVKELMEPTARIKINKEIKNLNDNDLIELLEALWEEGYYEGFEAAGGKGSKSTKSPGHEVQPN